METHTQQLIIKILGFLATLSLIEALILIAYTQASETITTQIILITSNIIGLLGGFIAGKTLTEKQSETLIQQGYDEYNENINDDTLLISHNNEDGGGEDGK